jgi:hypothetical protein
MSTKRDAWKSNLRRMLKDAAGRKAAEEIINEFLSEQSSSGTRLKIAVLMPSYKQPHQACLDHLSEAMRFAGQYYDIWLEPRHGGGIIHWVRNSMVANLLMSGRDFDYVLFVDDDMILGKEHIAKLVSHAKDITVPLCVGRFDPPRPVVSRKDKDWNFNPVIDWKDKTKELLRIDAAGTGVMLISKKALLTVAAYWMNCGYEKKLLKDQLVAQFPDETEEEINKVVEAAYGNVTKMRIKRWEETKNGFWFDFLPHIKHQHGQYGEDISFCVKADLCGLEMYCDTGIWPGHIGDYPFTFEDFIAIRELARPKEQHDANGHHQPGGLDDGAQSGEASGPATAPASQDSEVLPGEEILVEGEGSLIL